MGSDVRGLLILHRIQAGSTARERGYLEQAATPRGTSQHPASRRDDLAVGLTAEFACDCNTDQTVDRSGPSPGTSEENDPSGLAAVRGREDAAIHPTKGRTERSGWLHSLGQSRGHSRGRTQSSSGGIA